MKLSVAALCIIIPAVSAFAPNTKAPRADIKLDMATRRDILFGVAAATVTAGLAGPALALNTIPADNEIVKEQRTVVNKLDINNAAVADYMQFPGMCEFIV
jgi:expansin (peptidoglycan-binding protein)